MNNAPGAVPVVHSVFDARHLAATIAAVFFDGAPLSCELFSRSWTDVYRVFTADRTYAVRIWRNGFHADARIDYECRFLAWLGSLGFPVPLPQAQRDGTFPLRLAAPEGPRTLAVFHWAEGNKIGNAITTADAREMGELLARIHRAGQDCPLAAPDPSVFHRSLAEESAALAAALRHRNVDAGRILRGVHAVARQVEAAAQADLPRGILHGDFHASNTLRRPDGSLFVVDFDDIAPGLLVRDLAATRWSLERMGRGDSLFAALLAGYERIRPVSKAERALMPCFMAERDAWVVRAWGAHINVLGDPQGAFDASLQGALRRFEEFAPPGGAAQ